MKELTAEETFEQGKDYLCLQVRAFTGSRVECATKSSVGCV